MRLASERPPVLGASFVVLALVLITFSSGASSAGGRSLVNRKVSHYEDSTTSVQQALDNAATKFDLPIGSELNGELPAKPVSIDVSDGTVADVMDGIIKHVPGYKWAEINGVVNIMPKENANSVLYLTISHFRVHDATPPYVIQAIASLPEVRAWLMQHQVVEHSLIAGSILIGSNGRTTEPRVSLERRKVTLREIMNSLVVKKAGPRSWSFSRYGDSNQYLNIAID